MFKDLIKKIFAKEDKYQPGGATIKSKGGVTAFETSVNPNNTIGYTIQEWNKMPFKQKVEMVRDNRTDIQREKEGIISPLPMTPSPTLILTEPNKAKTPFKELLDRIMNKNPRSINNTNTPILTPTPISKPISFPTSTPTLIPTATSTPTPIRLPTTIPTAVPTFKPTSTPINIPTKKVTNTPTPKPTISDEIKKLIDSIKINASENIDINRPGLTPDDPALRKKLPEPTKIPTPTPTPDPRVNWRNFADMVIREGNKEGYSGETLARQKALESGYGKSKFAKERYNYGGIGAYDSNPNNAFSFKSPEEYLQYYFKMIQKNFPKAYANRNNPEKFVKALKEEGYASDPNYVWKVLNTQIYND